MHQDEWDDTPTNRSSARIIRGFSRTGIGAAGLVAILGLALTAIVADRDYEAATQWPDTRVAKADLPDVPPRVKYEGINDEAFKTVRLTVLIGMGITGTASLAVFGLFGGLGWVIARFARD
jgi:hypothetical protein